MAYASGETPTVGDYVKNKWEQPGTVLAVNADAEGHGSVNVRWDDGGDSEAISETEFTLISKQPEREEPRPPERLSLPLPDAEELTENPQKDTSAGSVLRNKSDLKWEKMLPELDKDSPVYSILRVDPNTEATTLLIEFPTSIHIPKHTHEKSETHFLLEGSHFFENNVTGERFEVSAGGYFYLPGKILHEAWVPAGARALIILESGWKVAWLTGPPTCADLNVVAPLI